MRRILAILALAACGSKPATPSRPQIVSERLSTQVDRMMPLVTWTCGGMPARSQGVDCFVEGDGVSMTGWSLLYGKIGSYEPIKRSIGGDGRPWRNPARVENDDANSFSRDQLLGLCEAAVASGDSAGLGAVMQWVRSNGRLCPGDDRCNLSGSTLEIAKRVLGERVSEAEVAVNGWTTVVEARTVPPGYQAHLVGRKIMLHAVIGSLTTDYQKAARELRKRFPTSLFVRTVDGVANGGDFVAIGEDLATCMEGWQGLGEKWVGDEIEHGCQPYSYGQEYISLAKFLLNKADFQ